MISEKGLTEWLASRGERFDALVLDIDGVLVLDGAPLPGGPQLIRFLRRRETPFTLLTNAANISVSERRARLRANEIVVSEEQIVSSGHPLKEAVEELGLPGRLFFVMGDLGRPCFAEAAGLIVTRNPSRLPECAGIVVGEEGYDWDTMINAVVNYFISNPAAPLVVPNPDRYFPTGPAAIRIGSGGIARLIAQTLESYGLSLRCLYLGKPFAPIFRHNHRRLEHRVGRALDTDRVLMVGDTLHGDIKGGRDFGYATALMLSGGTSRASLAASPVKPDMAFERL